MKWFLSILVILSLVVNGFFIYEEVQIKHFEEMGRIMNKAMGGGPIDKVPWEKGIKLFMDTLKQTHPELAKKKYFYVNIWATFCRPCIKEMPWLDSLAGDVDKDVAYLFITENANAAAQQCIDRQKFKLKKFVFLHDMEGFVDAAFNAKKSKGKSYPTILMFDAQGKIIHTEVGAYESYNEAKGDFPKLFKELK